mmetsp:Transcript_34640/g.51915  ORF Transcript_34640/g.51915 Transcript_34640/m.51915 type:complete len:86 (+) Transcript_34640:37-294(+)|eukprot:scaffold17235_cov172-Skeletonema_dohrnii-CCMP3373.AAC.2
MHAISQLRWHSPPSISRQLSDIILNPVTVLQDEGPKIAAKIAWNIATDASIRSRVVETRRAIKSHQHDLGYILIRAVANNGEALN